MAYSKYTKGFGAYEETRPPVKQETDGDTIDWANITSKPSTFAPSSHTHAASEITDFDTEVSNNSDVAANTTKLAGIESNATADQSDAEIETAYNNQVAQVSSGEIAAGTETGIRRFSPDDIEAMIVAHETSALGDMSGDSDDISEGSTNLFLTSAQKTKIDYLSVTGAIDLDNAILSTTTDVSSASFVLDEDNMATDSNTKVPTQQSVKAYVDDLRSDATLNADTDVSGNDWVVDEDDMSSNSNTKVPTQQSVKAYVDVVKVWQDPSSIDNNVQLTSSAQGATISGDVFNIVTSLSAANDALTLQSAAVQRFAYVYNTHATDTMKLFPSSGETIDALAINTAIDITAGSTAVLVSDGVSNWRQIFKAD